MRIINNAEGENALTTDKSAAVLGIHEFSLFSRIQLDEIKTERLPWGEIAISKYELERLLGVPANKFVVPQHQETNWTDSGLGIEKHHRELKRNGESIEYSVPNHPGRFTESEIKSYRAAFGAIANQLNSVIGLKKQLDDLPLEKKLSARISRWQVRSSLLNLGRSEILLCQMEDEFAAIEGFHHDESAYTKVKISPIILLRAANASQLTDDFKTNAYHTLKYMASNLTAKAQKVVWNQFSDCRPSEIMAAISERCLQAVSNDETIPQNQTMTHSANRGMKI